MRVLALVTNGHSMFFRQQMGGMQERGYDVDVLAVPGSWKDETRSVFTYSRYYLRALGKSFGDYDVVHANYGLTAPPAVLQPSLPTVLTLWGSDLMGKYGAVSRFCSRFADEVIVMSEQMAAQCGRECHVIPHGIDLDLFRPLPQPTARELIGWGHDSSHVLFPYSPAREVKNFPRARRVFQAAESAFEGDVELHWVSDVEHEEMPLYMNAADAMILTSNREGMPNTVKEAMACNLPVVATDVSDLRILLEGVSHSVVDEDDDVLATALYDVLRADERSDGRQSITPYGLDRQLDKLEAVYRDALAAA